MKKHEAFPGKFFRATDFDRPLLLTFARVVTDRVSDDEAKLVAYFQEDPRGMVINATKFDVLTGLNYGDDSDQWVGKQIVAFQGKTPFAGKMVPCISLRAPKFAAKPVPQLKTIQSENPADMDDEIPF